MEVHASVWTIDTKPHGSTGRQSCTWTDRLRHSEVAFLEINGCGLTVHIMGIQSKVW